jgi:hypothetical protein
MKLDATKAASDSKNGIPARPTKVPTKTLHQAEKEKLEKKLKNQRSWFMRRVVILGLLLAYCVGTIQMALPGGMAAVLYRGAQMNDQGTMVVSLVVIILAISFSFTARSFSKANRDWADYQEKMRGYAAEARKIKMEMLRAKREALTKEEQEFAKEAGSPCPSEKQKDPETKKDD